MTIPALYKGSSWKEKGENYPSTLHMGSLPGDCTAALEEMTTAAGGTQDNNNNSDRHHVLHTYSGDRSSAGHFYTCYIDSLSFIK